jgi:hypothetical protein
MSIARMLADKGLVLGGDTAVDPLATFLAELRDDPRSSDPQWIKMTAALARSLSDLDVEADHNPSATGLIDCLRLVAGAKGRIEDRILVMSQLVNVRGAVQVPRSQLHPKRKAKKEPNMASTYVGFNRGVSGLTLSDFSIAASTNSTDFELRVDTGKSSTQLDLVNFLKATLHLVENDKTALGSILTGARL